MKHLVFLSLFTVFFTSVNAQIDPRSTWADPSVQEINLEGGGNTINNSGKLIYQIVNASSGTPGTGVVPKGSIFVTISFPNEYGINAIPVVPGWKIPNDDEYPTTLGKGGQLNLINDEDIAEGDALPIVVPVVGFAIGKGTTTYNIERTLPIRTEDRVKTNNQLANDFTVDAALPVTFGLTSAVFAGDRLTVKWSTFSEKGNEYFIVEGSVDGKEYIPIGKMASKAIDGNSGKEIQYSFSKSLIEAVAYSGFSVWQLAVLVALFISVIVTARRTGKAAFVFSAALLLTMSIGCRKEKAEIEYQKSPYGFIRIGQVDLDSKDQKPVYGYIVKVITE